MTAVAIDGEDVTALRRLFAASAHDTLLLQAIAQSKGYPAGLLEVVLRRPHEACTTCTAQTLHVLLDEQAKDEDVTHADVARACLTRAPYYSEQEPRPPGAQSVTRNVRRVAVLLQEPVAEEAPGASGSETIMPTLTFGSVQSKRRRSTTTRQPRRPPQPSADPPSPSLPMPGAGTPNWSQHSVGNDSSDGGEDPMNRPGAVSQALMDDCWQRNYVSRATRPGLLRTWDEGSSARPLVPTERSEHGCP